MSRGFTLSAVLLASASLFALNAAHAAGIETVVVTAQKKTELLEKVPVSVKVLNSELLGKTQTEGLEDITKMVPSLTMTDISRGGNQVQIRGLGSNVASVGTVAIYEDGVIPPTRVQSSGTFSEHDGGIYDVDRVEVLRGPQGTLYGEGSFGGVINIISKKPNPDAFEASGSATWFSVDHGSADNHDLAGMVNVPVASDLAIRAVGYDYNHAGYIDTVNFLPVFSGAAPDVFKDANTEHVRGGRISIGYTPSQDFDATLILKTDKLTAGSENVDSPLLVPILNGLAGTNFPDRYTYAAFSDAIGTTSLLDQAILQVNADVGIGHLSSVTGYGWSKVDSAAGLHAGAVGYSEELRLSSYTTADDPFSWIAGAYYSSALRNVQVTFPPTLPYVHDGLEKEAIFGQAYWQFIPSWTATFGLRYEEQQVNFIDELNNLPTDHGKFHSLIPKFSISWQIDQDSLLYVTAAKGFRAGGTNADQSLGTDPTYVAQFKPDKIWNYEIGTKKSFFDQMLTVNAAAFYIDWSDIQIDRAITSVISPPLEFIVTNGKDAHSYGIEADVYLEPADDWSIVFGGSLVNAAYDNGTIDSATNGLGFPLRGQKLPGSPSALFNASVEKRFALTDELQAYLRGEYNYRGSSYGDVPNTIPDPTANLASGISQNLNLRAGVRGDFWEVQAFVTNVTDQYQSSYSYEWPAAFTDLHVVTQPRTFGLNLKVHTN
ncbi:MAG TPA: TonB-dependent receptor [Rhizomicrobium sp.]|jgi:iron complex outermembrane receptor protein